MSDLLTFATFTAFTAFVRFANFCNFYGFCNFCKFRNFCKFGTFTNPQVPECAALTRIVAMLIASLWQSGFFCQARYMFIITWVVTMFIVIVNWIGLLVPWSLLELANFVVVLEASNIR